MMKKNKEQKTLNQLNKILKENSIDELKKERNKLSSALHKLPWFANFFEETDVEGYTFTTEGNRYEIIKENNQHYVVCDRITKSLVSLSKKLEEGKYVLGASFNLKNGLREK